jgi:hypothetical protein
LIDVFGDVDGREQVVVFVRYVNSEGLVKERYIGIVSVKETSVQSLKETLDKLLSINGLSLSSIMGQVYDGASNMRSKYGGFRTLIQNESLSAYYVHCFAHQLQLTLLFVLRLTKVLVVFFSMTSIFLFNSYDLLTRDKNCFGTNK